MPFGGKDIPHIVIEVNQVCNISCKACYKIRETYTKPTGQIKEEIDLAVGARNLDMITLAGGEPTLHPDLAEIIRYVADKGIKVSLLTNGILLDDENLRRYKEAGLIRAMVHVDSFQKRPDAPAGATTEKALNSLRETILRRVGEHGIRGGLALTLYRKNLAELPDVMDFVFSCRWVSLVLVTLCKSFSEIAAKFGHEAMSGCIDDDALKAEEVTNREVARVMEQAYGMDPAHCIASNLRDSEWRWLFYLAFSVTNGDGRYRTMHLSSRFRRTISAANHLQKLLKGQYKFDMVPGRYEAIAVCLAYGISGMELKNLASILRFLSGLLRPGSDIRSKVIVVQQPPNLAAHGEIEHCKDCPDATVRNGRIMPLCLADIVSPVKSEPIHRRSD